MEKTIALIAHDTQKIILAEWANKHKKILKNFNLVGTKGTCEAIKNITGLNIKQLGHGPDGGDIVIASKVIENIIDVLIFFIDVRTPHGHEHDIQTLIRISVLTNIPIALNTQTADFIIYSELIKNKMAKKTGNDKLPISTHN